MRDAVLTEFGQLRVAGVPADISDICHAVNERKSLEDGRVLLAPASLRRTFWQAHMFQRFPNLTAAAARLLSAHVTSCSSERNWSLFGNIYTKTKSRLILERARKIAFIRSNKDKDSNAASVEDEAVMLSHVDLEDSSIE